MKLSKNIQNYLDRIRNKGNCIRTVHLAFKALKELRGKIEYNDYISIHVALRYMEIGKGPGELNDVLKQLKPKYEHAGV